MTVGFKKKQNVAVIEDPSARIPTTGKVLEYVRFDSGIYKGCMLVKQESKYGFLGPVPWRWYVGDNTEFTQSGPPKEVLNLVKLWHDSNFAGLSLSEFLIPLLGG